MSRSRPGDLRANANAAGPPLSPLPAGPRAVPIGWRVGLAMALVFYVCIASVHAMRAPVGATGYQDAPDEGAHVSYVRFVATGRLPSQQAQSLPGDEGRAYEWHQPPLYYVLAARLLPAGVRGMRLLSVVIGLCCILAIFGAVRVLFPDNPEAAALAAAIAALIPGHAAITSVVNNDGLLELWFSVFLLLVFAALVRGLTLQRSAMIGLVIGAALLTKATAVLLLPAALLALTILWRNGERPAAVARGGTAIVAGAAIVSGWWFARNAALYHEWLPLTLFSKSFVGTTQAVDVATGRAGLPVDSWRGYAALVAEWTSKSFLAVYSTKTGAQFGVPHFLAKQVYVVALLAAVASAAGLVRLGLRERATLSRPALGGLAIASAVLLLVAASFAMFTLRYFQAQGRYFYPAMLPIVLFAALGWQSIVPKRYFAVASGLLLVYLGTICIAFLIAAA
ncbi:MAG TPA: glycosyltransferase family 39 protein [Chthonomonadaceae bacterium]|nr:glycosyltransferase family 39 protein [Chthonomonadaceae bacterium]